MTQDQATVEDVATDVSVAELRFEHSREPLGIGTAQPRLSWTVSTTANGWRQAAYEIEAHGLNGQAVGEFDRVESDQSVLVPWPFEPLASRECVTVRVRVWGEDGQVSAWSEPAAVEAGLLDPGDWTARFVTPDWDEDTSQPQPGPLLRR